MAEKRDIKGDADPRSMALQDLAVVEEKLADLAKQTQPLLEEKAELEAFLRRYAKYEDLQGFDAKGDPQRGPTIDPRIIYPDVGETSADLAASIGRALAEGHAATSRKKLLDATGRSIYTVKLKPIAPRLIASQPSPARDDEVSGSGKSLPSESSRRGQVAQVVYNVLELVFGATTKELVRALRSHPKIYSFLGTNPSATLSSYLSRDPRFAFDHGASHWRLDPRWLQNLRDQDVTDQQSAEKKGEAS
ncbi:hypothetical protein [Brevundimonas diminuta]|uniref:hypothetical protein n=1 Tax=Brevundimonas diminuta TaxID=293 RepID=UPI003D9AAD6E